MQSPDVLSPTRRWLLDGLTFTVDTALGMTISGRFDRFAGSYEVGPDGAKIELAVDATSVDTTSGIVDGLLRSAESRALTDPPQVRFRSTHVRELGGGTLRVEGHLEAAGKVEPVAFDAAVKEADQGLLLEAVAIVDRERLGRSADRFAFLLPATVHVAMPLRRTA